MAVMRISSCDFSVSHNKFILLVDVYDTVTGNGVDARTYFVLAPANEIVTRERMQQFVERDISAQQLATPDWTGTEWKTTQV